MTGFATSVIACGCEAGIDCELDPEETPDARPGVRVLLFAVSTSTLEAQLQMRLGQCVLTCPGTACYSGLAGEERIKLGAAIRYFGDGWQIAKRLGRKRFWRVPGDGRRVRLRGHDGPDQGGGRRRQSPDHGPRPAVDAARRAKRRSPRSRRCPT